MGLRLVIMYCNSHAKCVCARTCACMCVQVETLVGEGVVLVEPPSSAARRATWQWIRVAAVQVDRATEREKGEGGAMGRLRDVIADVGVR